jgi:hypothetical protein
LSANSYLQRLAIEGVLRDAEKASVERSLSSLRQRLDDHFAGPSQNGGPLKRHFAFGSYTRGTILPRSMDPHSDVDYMVVFDDSDSKPQTYLDRLRRFVEKSYRRSEIAQSSPTIVLSLNHIRFELVPAIDTFFGGIQIPGKNGLFSNWMSTTPNEFNSELTEKNKSNENQIKPLVRIVKYWNSCNDYPYESFQLEKMVVAHWPITIWAFGGTLWDRFAAFMNDLSPPWGDPGYRTKAVERAKEIIREVEKLESAEQGNEAEKKLLRLLPEIGYLVPTT